MTKFNINCVRISTINHFEGNLLHQQFKLRHKVLVQKLDWSNIFVESEQEFDAYDNPSAEYFIATDPRNRVVGCLRTHPTTIPYMLSDHFPYLVAVSPCRSEKLLELSRLVCDDEYLTKHQRELVTAMLFHASIVRGLQRGIDAYVGFVDEHISQSVFEHHGWQVIKSSVPHYLDKKILVHGVILPINKETQNTILEKIQTKLSYLEAPELNFGAGCSSDFKEVAYYSPSTKIHKSFSPQAIKQSLTRKLTVIRNWISLSLGKIHSHSRYLKSKEYFND